MRILIYAGLLSLAAVAAAAQDNGMNAANMALRAETTGAAPVGVPIGHRQPTPNELPRAVRRNENQAAHRATDPLGPLPQICRDC